jgi:hypothetical protein
MSNYNFVCLFFAFLMVVIAHLKTKQNNIEESSLEEENNNINANEGLPEPYILIIQNTMDLSHSNFQDLDDNDENRSEYLSDEENILANDEYYEEEEEYNSNELASSFMTALHNSNL